MLCVILLNTNKLEHSIKQLFLKYLQNCASQQEIDRVLELLGSDKYEQEWESALADYSSEFEKKPQEIELLNEVQLYNRIASRISSRSKIGLFKWTGYAAALLLISFISYQMLRPVDINQSPKSKEATFSAIKPSGRQWLKLPDGTSVQLNHDSRIEYPGTFRGKNIREVTLIGEAFFDVAHDKVQPFVIHTGAITTTVLGTAFNISAYEGDKFITVTVSRGKVMVQHDNKTLAVLTPNQQLSWNMIKQKTEKLQVNAEKVSEWKAEDLIMDDITLDQAADMIANRFKVKVLFKNERVKRCRFTAAFLNRNDINQVMEVLSNITGATISLQGNQLSIDGPGCEN